MGAVLSFGSFIAETYPPKSTYSSEDIPDLTGKVFIVTGGNSGIGKDTIKALLDKNAKVYMACRSKERADAAIAELKKETGKEALFLELDLASLKSVKQSAETFASQERELHVLINNGGVMWPPKDQLSVEGYDLQFGTNVLGPFYFTKLLLPILIETSKSSPTGKARIITVSSVTRHLVQGIDYETLKPGPKRDKMEIGPLYSQTKFADAVLSKEFAVRYGDQGIVSIGVAPGSLKTGILRHTDPVRSWLIEKLMMYDSWYGALTQLYAATSPEAQDLNGAFLVPWARVGSSGRGTEGSKVGEDLWNWLEEQVKNM